MSRKQNSYSTQVLSQKLKVAACRGRAIRLSGHEAAVVASAVESTTRIENWIVRVTRTTKDGHTYKRRIYVCPQCGQSEIQPARFCKCCGLRLDLMKKEDK